MSNLEIDFSTYNREDLEYVVLDLYKNHQEVDELKKKIKKLEAEKNRLINLYKSVINIFFSILKK